MRYFRNPWGVGGFGALAHPFSDPNAQRAKRFGADRLACDVYREGAVDKSFRGASKAVAGSSLAYFFGGLS